MRTIWRSKARDDLVAQLEFVAHRSPAAAARLRLRVDEAIELLAYFPDIGRPSRRPGIRELVITGTPYVAVYRRDDEVIRILRFFHIAQSR